MSFLTLPVLLAPALASISGAEAWIPIDDPDAGRLPAAVRSLPQRVGQAYESAEGGSFLIVRHLAGDAPVEAFMADEDSVSILGELIPIGERHFDSEQGEGLVFDCEFTFGETMGRAAALYAPRDSGGLVSLWVLAPRESPLAGLAGLEALLPSFVASVEPAHSPRLETIILDHSVSFGLTGGAGDSAFALAPVPQPRDVDLEFFEFELNKHPPFKGDTVRQWADPERGITLAFQVMQGDVALGIKDPLVHHIAEARQQFEREDADDGDVPIELLHLPEARTVIVSDAEVERHYANNRMALEAGVILQTYIPRAPFSRVTRMRWQDGEGEAAEHVLVLSVELRSYPRSRSETICRTSLIILQARAKTVATLAAWEQGLAFSSRPLERPAPFQAAR